MGIVYPLRIRLTHGLDTITCVVFIVPNAVATPCAESASKTAPEHHCSHAARKLIR